MRETVWDGLVDRAGEIFEFRSTSGTVVAAELISADRAEHGATFALTLTFRAEAGIEAQGTYEVDHPEMETFVLFVVPRSPTDFDAVITWLDAP